MSQQSGSGDIVLTLSPSLRKYLWLAVLRVLPITVGVLLTLWVLRWVVHQAFYEQVVVQQLLTETCTINTMPCVVKVYNLTRHWDRSSYLWVFDPDAYIKYRVGDRLYVTLDELMGSPPR